jgi:hypothetical protein
LPTAGQRDRVFERPLPGHLTTPSRHLTALGVFFKRNTYS